jgi:SAM-dependent methyltransferase
MIGSFKEFIKTLEFPFCYYAYVIDQEGLIDYFHYGLWEQETKTLKEAQENLAALMKSLIPKEAGRILDVGCGLGRTTYDLASRGYDVVGISPDIRLMEMAREKYEECRSRLITSSFEEYRTSELFDLILFQESAQYIRDLRFLFSHCKELLNKGGCILMCDEVRYGNSVDSAFHHKEEIENIAHDQGFSMLLNKDITSKVIETRRIALRSFIDNKEIVINQFSPIRENVRQEVEFLIEGWNAHTAMFEKNLFGYEVFLFQSGCNIRPYKKGDEEGIVKLFKEIFGREMPVDEWRWKYAGSGNNKVYSSVAVTGLGDIVAHYGGMPHRMIYKGNDIYGLAIGDVMVHPKFRGSKLFKQVAAIVPEEGVKDGFVLGYGFPNERAMLLPEKLGLYEKVEDVLEANKEVRFNNELTRFIYKLFPLPYDDLRIDKLWEKCKARMSLAVTRDRDYLMWRYQQHPLFRYELWGLKKRWGHKLEGLAVLRREAERMLVIDFLCLPEMMEILFRKIENHSFVSGSKTVALWFPGYLQNILRDLGFSIKPSCTVIPRTTHERTLTKDEMAGSFFYTMGDTDFL